MTTSLELKPLRAYSPMAWRSGPHRMSVSSEHQAKACLPMLITWVRSMEVREEQPLKAWSPTTVRQSGRVTLVSFLQSWKAPVPIMTTGQPSSWAGMTTFTAVSRQSVMTALPFTIS